jgi:FKBP-type peptidyl-prolyl cis-trans isomerase
MIRISRAFALTSFAALLAASGCSGVDVGGGGDSATVEETTFASSLGVDLPNSTRTENGAYYRDMVVGTGPFVSAGQILNIKYSGWLSDGTVLDTDATLAFHLGTHEVTSGWDEAIPGMRVGGKRQLLIPPALAYGDIGSGPIPGNAVLVYVIEVVSAQ